MTDRNTQNGKAPRGSGRFIVVVLLTALLATGCSDEAPPSTQGQAGSRPAAPLATVVIGGLITATLLTLLVLPTIYNWLERDDYVPGGTDELGVNGTETPAKPLVTT